MRNVGKSRFFAAMAADALRRGERVGLARIVDGVVIVENVVCVPGFPDGRQLPQPK